MTASPLELAGLLGACGAGAVAILARDRRLRYGAIWVALLVAPLLVAGDVWHEDRFADLRGHPALLAAFALALLLVTGALARALERYPRAFPVLAIALLPLRVPVKIGGETADLLVPLYLLVAAEAARRAYAVFRTPSADGAFAGMPGERTRDAGRAGIWLIRLLAATLVLYAIQSAYTDDVSNAIENAGFFLVPFAVLFVLLLESDWSAQTLRWVLLAIGGLATAFAAIAFWQHAARHLTFNTDLLAANQLHTYFRVNAVFHDPNVLGRYLALAIVTLGAFVSFEWRDRRWPLTAVAVACLSVGALTLTYSLTSIAALIAGLVIVAWLRWGLKVGVALAVVVPAVTGAYVLVDDTGRCGFGCRDYDITEGRVDLFSGGLELAGDRPVWGWGSGSFGAAFEREIQRAKTTTSHTEPVTVAAEQGGIGLTVFLALLAVALAVLLANARGSLPRTAVAACFVAMVVHSLGYAAFLIDPATWALLALGLALPGDQPTV